MSGYWIRKVFFCVHYNYCKHMIYSVRFSAEKTMMVWKTETKNNNTDVNLCHSFIDCEIQSHSPVELHDSMGSD